MAGLTKAAVIANSDMGDDNGRVRRGLPEGAMHSRRKVNLGRRNGLAMIELMGGSVGKFAPHTGASGPVLESATIVKSAVVSESQGGYADTYNVTIRFKRETAESLHFAGAADCIICCGSQNGSAIKLRVVNASDATGYTWQRTELPTVSGSTVRATFKPDPASSETATVATDLLQFQFEGEPECVLYNGIGGPDNSTAVAASPFFVSLSSATGAPAMVPATPCASMLKNGSCYFAPEPCSGFTHFLPNGTHMSDRCPTNRCCWDPVTNKGQCEDKGSSGCNRSTTV